MESKQIAEILSKLDAEKYKFIIERAALNGYHDYKFDKVPGHPEYGMDVCPKITLVGHLSRFPELSDLRHRVISGDFDDDAADDDQEEMRGWLIEDNCPDFMFENLGLRVPTKEEREKCKP